MLTRFQNTSRELMMLQTSWASMLDPWLLNPRSKTSVLKNVQLAVGPNQINHLLGRNLQGWSIVRQRGPASFYDEQDSNPTPQLTLALNSSAIVSIDIEVY